MQLSKALKHQLFWGYYMVANIEKPVMLVCNVRPSVRAKPWVGVRLASFWLPAVTLTLARFVKSTLENQVVFCFLRAVLRYYTVTIKVHFIIHNITLPNFFFVSLWKWQKMWADYWYAFILHLKVAAICVITALSGWWRRNWWGRWAVAECSYENTGYSLFLISTYDTVMSGGL